MAVLKMGVCSGDHPQGRHQRADPLSPKEQHGNLQPDQARELRQLQEENARLNKLVADLSLDKSILQDVAQKLDI